MNTKDDVDQRFDKFEAVSGDKSDYDEIISNFKNMNHPHFNFVNNPQLTKLEKIVLCSWVCDIYQAHDLLTKMKEHGIVIIVKEGDLNAFITLKPGYKFDFSLYNDIRKTQDYIDDYRRIVYAFNHIPIKGKHSKAFYD
eukprot:jgi/Orpsp1_1/1184998/evm.model.c7180000091902.1